MEERSDAVRIYLCAAALDMTAERAALRERVLPRVRERLAVPGLAVSLLDPEELPGGARDLAARWRALDACRPFFVGLFGERACGEPAPVDAALAAAHLWLRGLDGASTFELDTAYALTQGDGAGRALFYLRDPGFIRQLPEALRPSYQPVSEIEARRMAAFKDGLRRSGRALFDGYPCRWDPARNQLAGLEPLVDRLVEDLVQAIRAELRLPASPAPATPRSAPAPRSSAGDGGMYPIAAAAASLEPAATMPAPPPAEMPAPAPTWPGAPCAPCAVSSVPSAAWRSGPSSISEPLSASPATAVALPVHEDVQFTVYRPRVVEPGRWETLLAFAHLSDRPVDADPDEPDPIEEVGRRARQLLGERAAHFVDVKQDSAHAVPHEAEITFVPMLPGFDFNPPRCTFLWFESVHQEAFRMRAHADLDGRVAQGRFSIFWGSLLLAAVQLNVRVDSHAAALGSGPRAATSAGPFGNIFASYSHKDVAIVEEMERAVRTLGARYLRDVSDLRAGEEWSGRLETMIQDADIFQLFWSRNAMRSPHVEREWRFALALGRPEFVRPTYWEDPLPTDPQRGLPPPELVRLHFQRLHRAGASPAPAAVDLDDTAVLAPPRLATRSAGPAMPMPGAPPASPDRSTGTFPTLRTPPPPEAWPMPPASAAPPPPPLSGAPPPPGSPSPAAWRDEDTLVRRITKPSPGPATSRIRWLSVAALFVGFLGVGLFVQQLKSRPAPAMAGDDSAASQASGAAAARSPDEEACGLRASDVRRVRALAETPQAIVHILDAIDVAQVQRVREVLSNAGEDAFVAPLREGDRLRCAVEVGPFGSGAAAYAAEARIRSRLGLPANVVPWGAAGGSQPGGSQ
jgi:hypothetical protein